MVVGAGFAGEGHTRALRYAGVEVVGICGREKTVVRGVADRLGIPLGVTDWRRAVGELKPDVVAIATPADLRRDLIEVAVENGCHIFCDKPLAPTAAEARELFNVVERGGIKHAYGATRRYHPSVVWLAELVRDGVLGKVREVEYTVPTCMSPIIPWSWPLVLSQGGGLLNGQFTHLLSIFERVLGGEVVSASGRAKFEIDRAPWVPGIHDYRDLSKRIDTLTPEELEAAEWRNCDADTSYSANLMFHTPTGDVPVTVVSGPDAKDLNSGIGMRLIGEQATLIASGQLEFEIATQTALPVPARVIEALPMLDGGCEDRWAALASEFVADILGELHEPYLTFRDGCRYQAAIEAIRTSKPWESLHSHATP